MRLFSKSITTGSQPTPPLEAALTGDGSTKSSEAQALLADQLEEAKDRRKEERFIWIVIVTLLVNVLWFKDSSNATLPIVALVLELIVLIVLAKRMGIEDVVELMDRLLHTVGSKAGGQSG